MPSCLAIFDGAQALPLELGDRDRINARLAPFVDPSRLRPRDSLHLALAPKVRLELGKYAQHVEKALAGRRAGVDWLLGRS